MKLPTFLNSSVTRAQIDHPGVAASVIRRLTGSSGRKGDSTPTATPAPSAPQTAPVTRATRATLTRTNGIDAARIAAGVPTDH